MMSDLDTHLEAVLELVERVSVREGQRKMIAIAGPPGSGKSTLAERVVVSLNDQKIGQAALVPMDGFHLDNADLDRIGLRAVKGAPQTFDARGFVMKVAALRIGGKANTFPLFDRDTDKTLPDAGAVTADAEVVVVEGNYLLLDDGPWSELRNLFSATIMLTPPLPVLEHRLIARWTAHGMSQQAAFERTHENDLRNARYVLEHSTPADLALTD